VTGQPKQCFLLIVLVLCWPLLWINCYLSFAAKFALNAADAVSFAVAAIGKKDEDGVYLLLYEARSREWYLKMQEKYKTS
jgi:hypothetical protein